MYAWGPIQMPEKWREPTDVGGCFPPRKVVVFMYITLLELLALVTAMASQAFFCLVKHYPCPASNIYHPESGISYYVDPRFQHRILMVVHPEIFEHRLLKNKIVLDRVVFQRERADLV